MSGHFTLAQQVFTMGSPQAQSKCDARCSLRSVGGGELNCKESCDKQLTTGKKLIMIEGCR